MKLDSWGQSPCSISNTLIMAYIGHSALFRCSCPHQTCSNRHHHPNYMPFFQSARASVNHSVSSSVYQKRMLLSSNPKGKWRYLYVRPYDTVQFSRIHTGGKEEMKLHCELYDLDKKKKLDLIFIKHKVSPLYYCRDASFSKTKTIIKIMEDAATNKSNHSIYTDGNGE